MCQHHASSGQGLYLFKVGDVCLRTRVLTLRPLRHAPLERSGPPDSPHTLGRASLGLRANWGKALLPRASSFLGVWGEAPALQAWTRWRCDVASCGQQMALLIQYCRLLVPRYRSFLIQPQSTYFSGISALLPACQPPAMDSWRGWAIFLPTQGSSAGEQATDSGPLFWREEVPCSLWLQAEAGGVKSP